MAVAKGKAETRIHIANTARQYIKALARKDNKTMGDVIAEMADFYQRQGNIATQLRNLEASVQEVIDRLEDNGLTTERNMS